MRLHGRTRRAPKVLAALLVIATIFFGASVAAAWDTAVEISPGSVTATEGSTQSFTVTVTTEGKVAAGVQVNFTVKGKNEDVTGTCTTSSGEKDSSCTT